MCHNFEKQNYAIISADEDTLVDELNMKALDMYDDDVKTDIYKLIINPFKKLIDQNRIYYGITQYALDAVCTENNAYRVVSKMETNFFDSRSVISIMVQSLQIQAYQVVLQAVEHVNGHIIMEARYNDATAEIGRRRL